MNQTARYSERPEFQPIQIGSRFDQGGLNLTEAIAAGRRNLTGLFTWLCICVGAGALYLYNAETWYQATTQVVLEPRRTIVASGNSAAVTATSLQPTLDSAQTDSEVEVVRSERNLRYVFDNLQIADNPLYAAKPPGLFNRLLARILPVGDESSTPQERAERSRAEAFERFRGLVDVRRIGQSYVLEITFSAPTPAEAARLANAITASYILEQINVQAASIERGTEYLQGRIADLKSEQETAAGAVKSGAIPKMEFTFSDARIVGAAVAPLYKSFPKSKLILLFAALFGVMSGVWFVFLRHVFDRRIRSRDQFRRAIELEPIGVLPRVSERRRNPRDGVKNSFALSLQGPESSFSRELRTLRTLLLSFRSHAGPFAIGITDYRAGDGGPLVASNLGYLLASGGESVLLMDGDLHNRTLTHQLAPNAGVGIHDLLLERPNALQTIERKIAEHLMFAPSAAAEDSVNPNLFVGSERMQGALSALRKNRHLIVALPPLSASSDAQAIGRMLDGVILCVRIGNTTIDEVIESRRAFAGANVRLLGVLLTNSTKR